MRTHANQRPDRVGRVVVPEYLPDEHVAVLDNVVEVVYDPDLYADRPRLLEQVAGARAVLIRNRTRIDAEFLAAATQMEVVGRLGVGLDNIDLEAVARAGVRVIPAYGANAVAVAEYVMGAIIHLLRGVFSLTGSMMAGHWPRQGHAFGQELAGKTLGLVGFGSISREVAVRAAGFRMRVIAHDPYLPAEHEAWQGVERLGLVDLLAGSDVVSLHVPFTEETRNLIGPPALSLMKRGAILVNTSRGGIVDEPALARALRNGDLGGAAIDVFASEPLGAESAAIFAGVGNLILTPHLAGNTHEAVDRVARQTVAAVLGTLGRRV